MPKILYKFPSRSRPAKTIQAIENIISLAKNDDYLILLSLDLDDPTTANRQFHDQVKAFGNKVMPVYGFTDGKVHAVNKDIWMVPDWQIVIVMSDDFEFLVEGFDLQIISDMATYFPNNDGFLHYPDGSVAKDVLCTMSILGRKYYDTFGWIYNPEYISVYCDNEATEVAKILKKHKFINVQIASHNHPAWGKCEVDDLYRRNENKELYAIDGEVFKKRQKMNFGL